jgi:cytochrome P450
MAAYLQRFDATPVAERWKLVRGWIFHEPLPFFAELRQERPILAMPEVTLAARFDDCLTIFNRYDLFSVALYKPKQGSYWMAQDDTAVHWREKSIMKAILDFEEVPAIRTWVAQKTAALLAAAGGSIDFVQGVARAVPIALTQEWFGYKDGDAAAMGKWSYWNQLDAFWNQPFDAFTWPDPAAIVRERELVSVEMAAYLLALVGAREAEVKLGIHGRDSVSRLVALSQSKAVDFDLARIVQNVGGLLIGAVETTAHCVVNALDWLMRNPAILGQIRTAAKGDDPAAVDGYVTEALRFMPPFPYFFRLCEQDTVLGLGGAHETPIAKGTTVLAVTHSAMFDPAALPHPDVFDPTRGAGNQFLLGYGLHECLGRAIASVMIPEMVRQALRLDGIAAGVVDYQGGPVPQAWGWTWDDFRQSGKTV